MPTLDGLVVLITGAGAGVGQALAYEAVGRGAKVVVASPHAADETLDHVATLGGEAVWIEADVSDYSSMENVATSVEKLFGGVNIVINNAAGSGSLGRLQDADPANVKRQFEINILGVFNGIHAFFPQLKAAADRGEFAHVVNVGSEHSLGVPPYVPAVSSYTVTKYATLAFTDVARRDFDGTGIGVSLLAPGWVLTEAVQGARDASPEFAASIDGRGQEPELVARLAFDGVLAKQHLIVTNPASRDFIQSHAEEIISALPAVDRDRKNGVSRDESHPS